MAPLSPIASIANLREIERRCLSGEALSDDLAHWLGVSLEAFLAHTSRTLDEAFGLRFPQGGVPWWREEAIRTRDRALRALGDGLDPALSTAARARAVRVLTVRYAAAAWVRDRRLAEMPSSYAGTARAHLWDAFKSGATVPLGERQLRTILG